MVVFYVNTFLKNFYVNNFLGIFLFSRSSIFFLFFLLHVFSATCFYQQLSRRFQPFQIVNLYVDVLSF